MRSDTPKSCVLYNNGACEHLFILYMDHDEEYVKNYEKDTCLRDGFSEEINSDGSNLCQRLLEWSEESDGK